MLRSINEFPLIAEFNPNSLISEAFRTLRTNIQFSSVDQPISVIMVTSAQFDEGKTTTLANLAITYAQEGKRVLMIDTDLRKPSLHHAFRQSNRSGLTDVLTQRYELDQVIRHTSVERLFLLPAGPLPPNPVEMLVSRRMKQVMGLCRENFDVVLVDTPPAYALSDAQIMSSLCDGVLLVVQAGRVKREMALKAKANLERVGAHVLGVVLNKVSRKRIKEYGYE